MAPRRIAVVTGSRAEYGILRSLLHDLRANPACTLQLVVTGMHLAHEFGMTVEEIRHDGFAIAAEVPMLEGGDSRLAAARSTGRGVVGSAEAFQRLAPEIVVVLGDRFEILAAAQAAMLMGIPVAHIHGGEVTEGSTDEFIRHAVSKMSSLHFTSTEAFRQRLIRMGELPERVHTVGAPGLDQFVRLELPARAVLMSELGLDAKRSFLLVTYHPATRTAEDPAVVAGNLLRALDGFADHQLLLTKANADPGGRAVNEVMEHYAAAHAPRAVLVASLGSARYLAAVREAAALVGNSSSGYIEAPAVGTPTVNLGERQKGRPRAASIVDCEENVASIAAALRKVLQPAFRQGIRDQALPYGRPGNVSAKIASVLIEADLGSLRTKPFHDA